jgi:putative hemolysin
LSGKRGFDRYAEGHIPTACGSHQLPKKLRQDFLTGLVLALLQRVPWVGDWIVFSGWRFEVLTINGRRIDKVRASREPAAMW